MANRTPFTRETNPLASDGPDLIDSDIHPDHPNWPVVIRGLHSGCGPDFLRAHSELAPERHANPAKQEYLNRLADRLEASPYEVMGVVPAHELAEMTAY